MRLLRAELRRFTKRRLIRWTLLAFVLLLGAAIAGASYQSRPLTEADRVAAQVAVDRNLSEQRAAHQERIAPCLEAVKQGKPPPAGFGPDCDAGAAPDPSWFPLEAFLPYQLAFADEIREFMLLFTALLALVGLVVGATFVGVEWSSGALANLLLWRPQRGRVLIAKVSVALGAMLAVGAATGALWVAGVYFVAKVDGSLAGTTTGVLRSVALDGSRAVALGLFATAFGCCVASIGRHTATAFGAALAVGLISEVGVRFAAMLVDLSYPDRYLLSTYAQAWVEKNMAIYAVDCANAVACELSRRDVGWSDSLAVFGAGTVLLMLVAFVLIRRRAIT